MNEGVKFDEVARNFSEDKARQGKAAGHVSTFFAWLTQDVIFIGGSLGWKAKGSLDPKFEEVAFELEPSTTGNPKIAEAKTGFGYHIIMVSCHMPPFYDASILHSPRSRDVNKSNVKAIYNHTKHMSAQAILSKNFFHFFRLTHWEAGASS